MKRLDLACIALLISGCVSFPANGSAQTLRNVYHKLPDLPSLEQSFKPARLDRTTYDAVIVEAVANSDKLAPIAGAHICFSQDFKVVAKSNPYCPDKLSLFFETGESPIQNGQPLGKGLFKKYRAWPAGKYVALCTLKPESSEAIVAAILPTSANTLASKGNGKVAFFKTVLAEYAMMQAEEALLWDAYFCTYFDMNAGLGSVAYLTQLRDEQDIAAFALRLAKKQKGNQRLVLDFIAGKFGSKDGYEPFFADLEPTSKLPGGIDIARLRVLNGARYVRRIDLKYVLKGVPPTRSNESLMDLALSWRKHSDICAFLLAFVDRSKGEVGLTKDKITQLYLATDEGMSFGDRYEVYCLINSFLGNSHGLDATPENISLDMQYPDGLQFPYDFKEEQGWKAALDAYWGIKRKVNP